MKSITRPFAVLLAASSFLLPQMLQIARAQPDETAPKTANPPTVDAQKAMDEAMKTTLDKLRTMTVEEMRAYTREMQEEMLRSQLSRQGFNDLEMQEIVIDFLHQQDEARQSTRIAAARLRDALMNAQMTGAKPQTSPEQWMILLAALHNAADTERERRTRATEKLSQTLKLNEQPRLDATLRLAGVIGDEIWYIGDAFSGMSALSTLPLPAAQPKFSAAEFDKGAQMGLEFGKKFATMTPEQIRDYLREIQADALRKILTANGFSEEKMQITVLDFVRTETAARAEIRLLAARLRDAAANPQADEWNLLQLSVQMQTAKDNTIARLAVATDELGKKLGLPEKPRLIALLHLYGFIGSETQSFADALTSGSAVALLPTPAEIKALPAQ